MRTNTYKHVWYNRMSEVNETTLKTSEVYETTLKTSEVFETTLKTSEMKPNKLLHAFNKATVFIA